MDKVDVSAFEVACGIGIIVTPEQVEQAVSTPEQIFISDMLFHEPKVGIIRKFEPSHIPSPTFNGIPRLIVDGSKHCTFHKLL